MKPFAVGHYVIAGGYFPSSLRLNIGIKWKPIKPRSRRKRRLFETWKQAHRYAMRMSDEHHLAWVYRPGHKPAVLWQWNLGER